MAVVLTFRFLLGIFCIGPDDLDLLFSVSVPFCAVQPLRTVFSIEEVVDALIFSSLKSPAQSPFFLPAAFSLFCLNDGALLLT